MQSNYSFGILYIMFIVQNIEYLDFKEYKLTRLGIHNEQKSHNWINSFLFNLKKLI